MGPQRVLLMVDCVSTKDLGPITARVNLGTAEMATPAPVSYLFLFSLIFPEFFLRNEVFFSSSSLSLFLSLPKTSL